jgi:hypothetical protein
MMDRLSPSDRRALRVGGIGVGAIVVVMVIVFPLMDLWNKGAERLNRANSAIANISRDVSDAAEVQLTLEKLKREAWVLPVEADLKQQTARLLAQVEGLPAYQMLNVSRLEGLPLRNEDLYYRGAVSLQFTGPLPSVHAFVSELEKAEPSLRIERLSINQAENNRELVQGQMVIYGCAVLLEKPKKASGGRRV